MPTGRKTALASMLAHCLLRPFSLALKGGARGGLQPFQPAQQSLNASWLPFAVKCRWYLSLVQLARDGAGGDKACSPEFPNCRSQGFGSRLCGLLVCLPIIDPAICNQAKARKHPRHSGAMPVTATGSRNSSSVQFIRQRTLGHEPGRHKIPNSRDQSMRVGIRGPLIGQRTMTSAHARRPFPAYSLHWAIMAAL
jgi:hypothetical protein